MTAPRTRASKVISVDVGKRRAGVALLDGHMLMEAHEVDLRSRGYIPYRMARALWQWGGVRAPTGALWVVERMMNYPGKGARTRDLDYLRKVTDELHKILSREMGHSLKVYTAQHWKGNVPKEVCRVRIIGELSAAEYRSITLVNKETIDAIGIGLFEVGRLGRGMTK